MEITFNLDPGAEPAVTVTADSRDIYVWERIDKTGRRTLRNIMERWSLADLYPLAWVTARRTMAYQGTEAEFVDLYPRLDFETQEEDAGDDFVDPTQMAASSAPASNSPSGPEFPPTSGVAFPNVS